MPVPTFNKLPPDPSFSDLVTKINQLVGEMTNLMLNLDSLNVVSLTADHIDAGTIDANIVTIRSDLNSGAYVQINGNGVVINNGSFNTFTADINGNVTMTSALIRSALGYPQVVIDPTNELFGAYFNAAKFINIKANDSGDPLLFFENPSALTRMALTGDTMSISTFGKGIFSSSQDLEIDSTGGNVVISANGLVVVESWSKIYSSVNLTTLQSALNAKANAFSGVSGTVYVSSSPEGPTDTAISFSNGIRVF